MKLSKREFKSVVKEELKKVLLEGTWSAPSSPEKARRFERVMQSPIPLKDASEVLYDLVGNDTLFDQFLELEEAAPPNFDVRPVVARFIKRNWFPYQEEMWSPSWDKEALDIVKSVVNKYTEI